jgi:ABC-type transport system involved in multi-copper enzyme maturation permease subunit
MRETFLIAAASIKNNLRLKAVVVVMVIVVLLCAGILVAALCLLAIAPAMKAESADRATLENFLGLTVFSASLVGLGINMNVFAFQTMTREKARGNVAALLATPLEAGHIWLGKSLAVFLPGLALGEALGLVTLFAVNYIYFVPGIGFLVNPWIILGSLLAVPLVYLSLSLIVHLVGLTGKPATGNVIVQIFLPVFASLMINLGVHHVLDVRSWPFTAAVLGLAAAIGLAALLMRKRLTAERIVLSR